MASMISFPVLQYSFRKSELLRETVPLLAYSVEGFIISCLGIRSNKRFNRMLKIFRDLGRSDVVIARLLYFKEMNMLISIILCFYALTLGILCIDALTSNTIIAKSKIGTDFLMANCNTCAALMWVVGIFILHPRHTKEEIEADNRSRLDEKYSLDTKEHTTIVMNNMRGSSDGCEESKPEEKSYGNRRLSNRITSFINNKRVADSTSVFEDPLYLPQKESSKLIVARIIHSSNLPIRTSSRANANIPVNNGLTSLNPPRRPKPKQSPSSDSLRKVNLPEIEDSFNRGSVSTVSTYGSCGHKSTQDNSTQSVKNNQHENTWKSNEENNNEIELDKNWLRRSPTKVIIPDL
ncbi:hypothetical protein HPULCUR_004903 [Helicostylum pulchrum]|uniref:Integral membrane protein n=1 Tax=Helicostylum pulchrum TaxID=562976 RepID=A0ABP9XXK5_9FUNG